MSSEAQGKEWRDPPCDRRLSQGPEVPTGISFLPSPPAAASQHRGDSAHPSGSMHIAPPWAVLPGCLGAISAVWASLLIKYEDWTKSISFQTFSLKKRNTTLCTKVVFHRSSTNKKNKKYKLSCCGCNGGQCLFLGVLALLGGSQRLEGLPQCQLEGRRGEGVCGARQPFSQSPPLPWRLPEDWSHVLIGPLSLCPAHGC